MATPIGHALVGMMLARRLGVTSPAGKAAAVVAAGFPDVDVLAGFALHRDPWRLHTHGKGTHTFGFAVTSGMLAGFAGLVSAGNVEGERDLIADAIAGAVLVGSHILLDAVPLPYLKRPKGRPGGNAVLRNVFNWTLDAVVYGTAVRVLMSKNALPASAPG